MKKILSSLIALLLACVTLFLCACGSTSDPTPDDPTVDPGNDPSDPNPPTDDPVTDIYDPSLPMADFSATLSSYLYPTQGKLLAQPETNVYATTAIMRSDILKGFANADEIIAKGRPEHPLYGIYTYSHEHYDNQDSVVNAGFTSARVSSDNNGWTDEMQTALSESGMKIMTGCSGDPMFNATISKSYFLPERAGVTNPKTNENMSNINNYDLAGWINSYIEKTSEKIDRLGPNGTFWRDHPGVNYNPVIYYEFFNEPNYQYLIPIKRADNSDDANAAIKLQVYAIMQTCVYTALHAKYGDEVQFVGMSAGGGAQEELGASYIQTMFSYNDDGTGETQGAVYKMLNRALTAKDERNPENAIVQYATESNESFAARKASIAKLREYMGLEDGEKVEIDLINTMDVMSIHPYMDGASPFSAFKKDNKSQGNVIAIMRQAMIDGSKEKDKERAANMPIWFTECGWQLKGEQQYKISYPDDVANGITGGKGAEYTDPNTGTSQILQAAMSVQDYLWGIRNGIDFISYMHMYDTDGCNYGLVNYGYSKGGDRSPRLVMYAIETMTTLMPNPVLHRVVFEGNVGNSGQVGGDDYLFIYEIESDIGGEIVTTVFSPLWAVEATFEWDDEYALVTDMFGKSQIIKAVGGQLTITAGPYMQYVTHVDEALLIQHGLKADVVAEAIRMLSLGWNGKEDII